MATRKLPRFHKRHYEMLAKAMQDALLAGDRVHSAITVLADMFAKDNGAFDRDRFERACVPGANVRARTSNGQALPSNDWRAAR